MSFRANFYVYPHLESVVFEQVFTSGVKGASVGDKDNVISAFPSFIMPVNGSSEHHADDGGGGNGVVRGHTHNEILFDLNNNNNNNGSTQNRGSQRGGPVMAGTDKKVWGFLGLNGGQEGWNGIQFGKWHDDGVKRGLMG